MRLLVTGSSGFIGGVVLERAAASDKTLYLRGTTRGRVLNLPASVETIFVGDLTENADWKEAVKEVDVVVHTAARVHVMSDTVTNPLAEFRRVNVSGTINLAHQAVNAGVRRFVYISSIKVNGEGTSLGHPYTADNITKSLDPYGVSKREAEVGLQLLAKETGIEVVIIRPPLVYGQGVKANFLNMMNWLNSGVPLPLGAVHNKRSLVALDNLVDLILTCIDHPAAANQTFLVSDGEDLSTTELLRKLGGALGKPACLLPVPVWLLKTGAALLGKRDIAQRLLGSLQVDICKARNLLGWTPPVSVDDALKKTAQYYLEHQRK